MFERTHRKQIEPLLHRVAHYANRIGDNVTFLSLNQPPKLKQFYQTVSYDQVALLKKINACLAYNGKKKISEGGHCHGLTLFWMTMVAYNLEPFFYRLVQEIVDCPNYLLVNYYKTITTFLELIDLGQNPKKYSPWQQQDVAKITGLRLTRSFVETPFTQEELANLITNVAREGNVLCLTGWRTNAETLNVCGHSIGLYYQQGEYYLFDANYPNGKRKSCPTAWEAMKEVWRSLFEIHGPRNEHNTPLFDIHAVERFLPPAQTFFAKRKSIATQPQIQRRKNHYQK